MRKIKNLDDLGMSDKSRVLCVMPHPDDETAFCGILLKRLSAEKIPLRAITMTKGEKSSDRYGCGPQDNLAEVRTKELRNAYTLLGVSNFTIHSISDGGIAHSEKRIKDILEKEWRTVSPTDILVIEPDGVYGHPDHIALTEYVMAAKPEKARLIYCTVSEKFKPSRGAAQLAEKKRIKPLKATHYIQLSPQEILLKLRAMRCHTSQFPLKQPLKISYLLDCFQKRMLIREYFVLL